MATHPSSLTRSPPLWPSSLCSCTHSTLSSRNPAFDIQARHDSRVPFIPRHQPHPEENCLDHQPSSWGSPRPLRNHSASNTDFISVGVSWLPLASICGPAVMHLYLIKDEIDFYVGGTSLRPPAPRRGVSSPQRSLPGSTSSTASLQEDGSWASVKCKGLRIQILSSPSCDLTSKKLKE